MKNYLIYILVLFLNSVYAQDSVETTFQFNDFLKLVSEHHPMARKAEIKVNVATAEFASARGNFDPEISSQLAQKYFQGTEYYNLFGASLKIPTWFGIEVYSGTDINSGTYLNPERNVPENGLWYAGISIPIGQDLFIDSRMFEYKKADLYADASQFERQLLMNELLLDASITYWNWFKAYNTMQVFENAYETARERFNAIRTSALAGDRPYIDTVEANIHLQNRYMGLIQAKNDFEIKGNYLSTYLWAEGFIPLVITDKIVPPNYFNVGMNTHEMWKNYPLDSILISHPKMKMAENKLDYFTLEKRYRQEQLKPQIDLKYNFLTESFSGSNPGSLSMNNYVWGFEFSTPILLMQERNQVKVTKLKMEDAQLSIHLLYNELSAEIFSARNNWRTSEEQLSTWTIVTANYQELFEAESTLFRTGESSLFMINSREMDLINSNLRLIDLIVHNQIAAIKTKYSYATLNSEL